MFQEAPCTGADRRELRCSHEARWASAWQVSAVCHWLCFLYGQKVFSVTSPESRQNKVSGRLQNFWRRSLAFSSVRALRGLPLLGRLFTVLVSRNFLNSLLTPHLFKLFSGNSSVNLFAVYPFKYKRCVKILSSSLNIMLIVEKKHCSDASVVTNFRCHKLIAKVNK